MWPTLQVLVKSGGSASIQEISEDLVELLAISDEVLEIPHGIGPQSEIDYRAAWARTCLKNIGAAENSERGIWSITDRGRRFDSEEQVRRRYAENIAARRKSSDGTIAIEEIDDQTLSGDNLEWEDVLLRTLKRLEPKAFERLCQRLLRESGFTKVEVTGRTGDGGIDGVGVLRINLLSFHVLYQCKRYDGGVGAREIRDFRGAMVGRTDKGVFLTTGHFTKDAEREAVRDGAPVIDLIDGMELCRLLKSLDLGVETRKVEAIMVREEFFESI